MEGGICVSVYAKQIFQCFIFKNIETPWNVSIYKQAFLKKYCLQKH